MTGKFEDVFGERRGSHAEALRQFAALHADIKNGQLERTLQRLSEFNDDGTLSAHADNAPLQLLLEAFAGELARQAGERWRPHVAELLHTIGVEPTEAMVEEVLQGAFQWTVTEFDLDPTVLIEAAALRWLEAWANARIADGLGPVLAPIFRANPQERIIAAVGAANYEACDEHCRDMYSDVLERRLRDTDETRWGAVFSMLGEYGCDLQPGEVKPVEVKRGLEQTLLALIDYDL